METLQGPDFLKPDASFGTIFDGLPVGVCVFVRDQMVYFNQTFAELAGVTLDEPPEQNLNTLFSRTPHGEAYAREIIRKILTGELNEHVWDNPLTHSDGKVLILRGHIRRIELDLGNAMLVTLRDITEQRIAEKAAAEQAELFRLIGENSADFIYVHDPSSKLSYVSPGVEAITGYPADDWNRHAGTYVIKNAMREFAVKATRTALETGIKQPPYNVEITTKDGRIRTLEVNETPYRRNGDVVGIVGVARDITERLEAERALARINAELEARNTSLARANQEMEAFIYTVSHDLKAPLVTLHGMTDRLAQKYLELLDERGRHYLERIRVNIEHLEDLVLDLLELSRIGRIEEAREVFDVVESLKESIEQSRAHIESKKLTIECPDAIGLTMFSRKRLRQVFTNLITNAAKYSDSGRAAILRIQSRRDGDFWEVAFQDNGRGVDPKFHEKIFAAFQRPGSLKEDEGTGIGLTIARRIIEYNGGRIWIDSQPGIGSTFFITIPIYEKEQTCDQIHP